MCFVHSANAGAGLVQRVPIGEAATAAFGGVTAGAWATGMDVAGSGRPDVVAGADEEGRGGGRGILDRRAPRSVRFQVL